MVRRHEIQVLRRAGHEQAEVAKLVGVSKRTVERVDAEKAVDHFDTSAEREKRRRSWRDLIARAETEQWS